MNPKNFFWIAVFLLFLAGQAAASSSKITQSAVAGLTPDYVSAGATKVPMATFTLTSIRDNGDNWGSGTSAKIEYSGTDTADVSAVYLYAESDGNNGTFDSSTDVLCGQDSSPDNEEYRINPDSACDLDENAAKQFYLAVDIAPSAENGNTVDLNVSKNKLSFQSGDWPGTGSAPISPAGHSIIDTIAPDGNITVPAADSTLNGTATIDANASDSGSGIARVEFWFGSPGTKIGEDTSAPYSIQWDTNAADVNGTRSLYLKVYDNAGNSLTTGGVQVTVDNDAPAIALAGPDDSVFTASNSADFNFSADDNSSQLQCRLLLNGIQSNSGDFNSGIASAFANENISGLNDGPAAWRVSCTDNVANEGTSPTRNLNIDRTAPSTGANAGSYDFNSWTNDKSVSVSLACEDGNGAGCTATAYCTDTNNGCAPATEYSAAVSVNAKGISYIRFYSTDGAGNIEGTESRMIRIADANQLVVDANSMTTDANTHEIIVQSGSPLQKIVVPDTVQPDQNVWLDFSGLVDSNNSVTLSNGLSMERAGDNNYSAVLPAGTKITGGAGWNGTINVPTVKAGSMVSVTPDSGTTAGDVGVIEIGFGDTKILFDKAARLLFSGQAGKYAGYSRNGTFYPISTTCSADTQAAGDALPAEGDCRITVGSDLVIWTKHFTLFATFTQTSQASAQTQTGGGSTTANQTPAQAPDATTTPALPAPAPVAEQAEPTESLTPETKPDAIKRPIAGRVGAPDTALAPKPKPEAAPGTGITGFLGFFPPVENLAVGVVAVLAGFGLFSFSRFSAQKLRKKRK
ncbi:MAG: hypothetical protein HY394_00735 [Candidatus Diapherotrites archaeon]|nr:hypothetical protein [Candidatus Diapherotrites archaeon]